MVGVELAAGRGKLTAFSSDPSAYRFRDPYCREQHRDYVSTVAVAYSDIEADGDWLEELGQAAHALLDRGLGVIVYTWRLHQDGVFEVIRPVFVGVPDNAEEGILRATELTTTEWLSRYHSDRVVSLHREVRGLNIEQFCRLPEVQEAALPLLGARDALKVNAVNPDGTGLTLNALSPDSVPPAPRTRAALSRVAAHLAAALRLRQTTSGQADRIDKNADAVFDQKGRVLHAEGKAKSRSGLKALTRSAAALRLSRGGLRREDPERALQLWKAMTRGEWSLIDRVDTDGKRFLVARRNAPVIRDPLVLSTEERTVAAWSAFGHPVSLIAYELGVSAATVSERLGRAKRKLGLESTAELVALFARGGSQTDHAKRTK